jgi:hypothetical protein
MENVEGGRRAIQSHDAMPDTARNAVHLASAQDAIFIAHEKVSLTGEDHTHLFMGVGMLFHDRPRGELDETDEHLLAPHRLDRDPGKDRVLRALFLIDKVAAHSEAPVGMGGRNLKSRPGAADARRRNMLRDNQL